MKKDTTYTNKFSGGGVISEKTLDQGREGSALPFHYNNTATGVAEAHFAAYCKAFDEKALKVAKSRYQNMNAQRMELVIEIWTTPFVGTALADFQRQPCDATQAVLIDEIITAYKEKAK